MRLRRLSIPRALRAVLQARQRIGIGCSPRTFCAACRLGGWLHHFWSRHLYRPAPVRHIVLCPFVLCLGFGQSFQLDAIHVDGSLMSKFHRDTSVLEKRVIALKLDAGFSLDQDAGSFSLSIGHGAGFSLEQISRGNCGGVRHLRAVSPALRRWDARWRNPYPLPTATEGS